MPSENILRYFTSPDDEIPRAVVPLASIHDATLGASEFAPNASPSCIVLRVSRQAQSSASRQQDLVTIALEALNVAEAKLWMKALNIYLRDEDADKAAHQALEHELNAVRVCSCFMCRSCSVLRVW